MNEQVDHGTIKTRSGTWEWTLKTFTRWPKSSPVSQRIRFRDPANGINTMSVRIDPEVHEFRVDSVRHLSLRPLSRRFQDSEGGVWVAHPAGENGERVDNSARRVSLHSLQHPSKITDLPAGRTLGDAKNSELVELL